MLTIQQVAYIHPVIKKEFFLPRLFAFEGVGGRRLNAGVNSIRYRLGFRGNHPNNNGLRLHLDQFRIQVGSCTLCQGSIH